jgi:hypothetical protein
MSISAEQWDKVAKDLERLCAPVKFQLGDMTITYTLERASVFSNVITTFVNDEFKGAWGSKRKSFPEQQFLNTKWSYVYDAKSRKRAKRMSKKLRRELGIDPDKKAEFYTPLWTSITSLIRHLKTIDGLTIVEEN